MIRVSLERILTQSDFVLQDRLRSSYGDLVRQVMMVIPEDPLLMRQLNNWRSQVKTARLEFFRCCSTV